MRSVRISMKTARTLEAALEARGWSTGLVQRAVDELRAAMAPKKFVKAAKAVKAKKKATKREKTDGVRKAVWARAVERCEACGTAGSGANPLDLDHFFRRVNGESLEECWLLCRTCHKSKHTGVPTLAFWFEHFAAHCEHHGYAAVARRAMTCKEYTAAKAELVASWGPASSLSRSSGAR